MGRTVGQFVLEARVGRGGMGEVWRALHSTEGTPVAVKLIARHHAEKPGFQKGFRTEVRAIAGLGHRHVCGVYDYGVDDEGLPWMAMELGERSLYADCGQAHWPWLRDVLLSVLDGLAHTHARDIVHRDIKPGNILLCDGVVKLVDFGLAHRDDEPVTTASGTPAYMPPEQLEGRWRDFGPWTDLYALGGTAWALACGAPPVPGRVFAPVHPMPRGFVDWLDRVLAPSPRHRFPTAAHAARALIAIDESDRIPGRSEATEPGRDHTEVESASPEPFTSRGGTDIDAEPGDVDPVGISVEFDTLDLDAVAAASPSTGVPIAATALPFPSEWRRARPPSIRLSGVGLGLYGLRAIPLVGREAERDVLWRALGAVLGGEGSHAVVIRGSAGVGKSRLAEWLCRRARELGVVDVLVARHGAREGATDGVVPMLRRHLRLEGLEHDAAARRVEMLFGAPDPVLAELLQPKPGGPGPEARQLGEPGRRQQVVAETIGRLARRRPLILWLDDVQWGLPTIELARALVDSDLPVLLVLTVQEEALAEIDAAVAGLGRLTSGPAVTELPLAPLTGESRRELAEELLGLASDVAEQVAERTAGNPLFAVQLVGDWVQRGILVPSGSRFALRPGATVPLPNAIHELWVRRVQSVLSDHKADALTALEVASLLGVDVDAMEWEGACREAGVDVPEALVERMVERGLARATASAWSFTHGMLNESMQRTAAEAGRLADRRKAVCRALTVLGGVRIGLDPPETGEQRCRRAVALAREDGDLLAEAMSLHRMATHIHLGRRPSDAGVVLRDAQAAARLAGDRRVEGGIRGMLGMLACEAGDVEEARATLESTLAIAREFEDVKMELNSLTGLGRVALQVGRTSEAVERYDAALALSRRTGAVYPASIALYNLGILYERLGRIDLQAEASREARDLSRACGKRVLEGRCSGRLGFALVSLGRLDDAEAELAVTREVLTAGGFVGEETMLDLDFEWLAWRRGRIAEAEACGQRALMAARELGDRELQGLALERLADHATARGDVGAAVSLLDEALALHEATRTRSLAAPVAFSLAVALARAGRHDEARQLLDRELSAPEPVRTPAEQAAAACAAGTVAVLGGDLVRARAWLDEARALVADLPMQPQWPLAMSLAKLEASL